ncbi:hypothetical protein H1D32_18045 [Anaerobacillus sp. CMMVII]|uniref:hypothetical protein n=1 Tax=Anaerobacillus sp. CMMVII TaxID=2755588 RepID=UPI0021B8146F|nr:hypothetical protein [Anaerobacillus sp. CMMVII]MCT8139437.1 hypothetical protein [Anaerobacillus sp. CMMVII]
MVVTLATMFTAISMFLTIIIIDSLLYKVSLLKALQIMFNVHISIGVIYLIFAIVVALVSALIIDLRLRKSQ